MATHETTRGKSRDKRERVPQACNRWNVPEGKRRDKSNTGGRHRAEGGVYEGGADVAPFANNTSKAGGAR